MQTYNASIRQQRQADHGSSLSDQWSLNSGFLVQWETLLKEIWQSLIQKDTRWPCSGFWISTNWCQHLNTHVCVPNTNNTYDTQHTTHTHTITLKNAKQNIRIYIFLPAGAEILPHRSWKALPSSLGSQKGHKGKWFFTHKGWRTLPGRQGPVPETARFELLRTGSIEKKDRYQGNV